MVPMPRSGKNHWTYEINQLQKLGTWVVEDLPTGQTAIPCSEVMRVKRGLDSKVQSYRVWIIAGGHRQVEGVNDFLCRS